MTAKNYLNYVLQDDGTLNGGTSFNGETLGDFLASIGKRSNLKMENVNQVLTKCGIMPIKF